MIDWTLNGFDAAPAALGAVTATEYYRHGEPVYAVGLRRFRSVGVPLPVFLGDHLRQMVRFQARSRIQCEVPPGVSQGARTRRDCSCQRAVPPGPAGSGFRFRV